MSLTVTPQPPASVPVPAVMPVQAIAPIASTASATQQDDGSAASHSDSRGAVYVPTPPAEAVPLYDAQAQPQPRVNLAETVAEVFARHLAAPVSVPQVEAGSAKADVQAINMTGEPPAQPDPAHLIAQAAYQMITDGLPTREPVLKRG